MATTPEGKIKKLVKACLDSFTEEVMPQTVAGITTTHGCMLYQYWPVPMGMGPSSLDCIVCYRGHFIGIETKAPGKKPTPRQDFCINQIESAGGVTFVIDSEEGVEHLRLALEMIRFSHANVSK